jgi:hypothetical protein
MSLAQDPTIIAAAIARIQAEIGRIENLRSKNRQVSIIVGGAIIGFAIKESSLANVFAISFVSIVVMFVFYYQDLRLHRYRHGWNAVDKRIRKYVRGEIDATELRLLEYDNEAEKTAELFSKSSGLTYIVIIVGSILTAIYKYIILSMQ